MATKDDCGMCRFGAFAKGADQKVSFTHKVCKRFPGTPMMLPAPAPVGFQIQTLWPVVNASDWCGEFRTRDDVMALHGSQDAGALAEQGKLQ